MAVVLMTGFGTPGSQFPAPSQRRSRLRSSRRARGADLSRQPGVQQRRVAREPTTGRCSSAWRRSRESLPSAARRRCRPARSGRTSSARSGRRELRPTARQRMPASVRMVTPGYFPALGLRIADGRAIDDRDQPDIAPGGHGQRNARQAPVAGPARGRPAAGGGLQHGRHLSVRSRRASSATCAFADRAASRA